MKLCDIPTPALLVDRQAMERNIQLMAAFFRGRPCKLRPHFKAHKTPAIARRQLAAGSCTGITCATVSEAEVVATAGVSADILIANEVLGPGKAMRVAKLAAGGADIKVAVDSSTAASELAEAVRAAAVEIGVLVDVNVGLPRCGIAPGGPALELAGQVASTEGLRLRGVMGYEGHAVAITDREAREAAAGYSMEQLLATARMIREAGLSCDIVSAGGTGTYDITGRIEGITEIQAGSYVLMDTAYAKLDLPFERALSLLGTVLSRPGPTICVTDSGHKACTEDHGNPSVKGIEGAFVLLLSDEHATIMLPADSPIAPGDRIELWPSHIDPTINLHDALFVLDGDEVTDVWPIAARGYPEQRTLLS
jgi:D-serine deaminase-like pyridoxal phosphate-dependent protein